MLSKDEQVKVLSGLSVGDVFECGTLLELPGAERLVWRCTAVDEHKAGKLYRFSIHYMGLLLREASVVVSDRKNRIQWRQS